MSYLLPRHVLNLADDTRPRAVPKTPCRAWAAPCWRRARGGASFCLVLTPDEKRCSAPCIRIRTNNHFSLGFTYRPTAARMYQEACPTQSYPTGTHALLQRRPREGGGGIHLPPCPPNPGPGQAVVMFLPACRSPLPRPRRLTHVCTFVHFVLGTIRTWNCSPVPAAAVSHRASPSTWSARHKHAHG